jgi:hypothetical protein
MMKARPRFWLWMSAAPLAAGMVGCTGAPPEAGEPAAHVMALDSVSLNSLSTNLTNSRLAADDQLGRFSKVPPSPVELAARPDTGNKGTLLMVRFAGDGRLDKTVTLEPDKVPLVFRDDGTNGDERDGDGVFTARTELAWETVVREHKRLQDYLKSTGERTAPQFKGRQLIAQRTLPSATSRPLTGALVFPMGFLSGVDSARSLMVTDLRVVENPARTYNPCTGAGTPNGKWTFGYLMRAMAGAGNPSTFARTWLEHWLADQTVNTFVTPARPTVQQILDSWPKTATGALDLNRAPFKLLAIVNRIDLAGNAGYTPSGEAEGRFVFQWMNPVTCTDDAAVPLLVILEYGVPNTNSCEDLRLWAWQWKILKLFPVGSAPYNAALESLTERWAAANAEPANPNGSALNQLRTNDFKLEPLPPIVKRWELREFRIQPAGQFAQVTVINTPDDATFNEQGTGAGSPPGARRFELGNWINANAADILQGAHSVPLLFPFAPGGAFRSGGITSRPTDFWSAPNIVPFGGSSASEVRHNFSLNTCDGCHTRETATSFTHVKAVSAWNQQAPLSGFLTGNTVVDPLDASISRNFNDLDRRKQVLNDFAFAFCGPFFSGTGALVNLPEREEPVMPFPPMAFRPVNGAH